MPTQYPETHSYPWHETLKSYIDSSVAEGDTSSSDDLTAHIEDTSNPHNVTKAQVGLGNAENTSDANKPISTATQAALDALQGLIDAVSGDYVTSSELTSAINAVVGAAPGVLDTLAELGDALGDDPNFATTIMTTLAGKADDSDVTAEAATRAAADTAESNARIAADAGKVNVPRADSWPTYIYGNSYSILSASYFTSGNHYSQQVAATLGGGAVTSYGISSKRILDVISALERGNVYPGLVTTPVAGGVWPGVSSRSGLVILESIINDIGHFPTMVGTAIPAAFPSGNTRYLDSMVLFYRHALAMMTSETRVEQTSRTATSGTWSQDQPASYASGGTVSWTTQNGAYHEFSITPPQSGPMRGVVFVHGFTLDTSVGTMSQQTISVDGVVQITRTPSGWEQYTGPGGVAVNVGSDCFAVTVPVDGSAHTIRLAHSGSAGQFMYSNFISIPSIDPNPIAVMGAEHALDYTGWTAAQKSTYHANAKTMIPIIKNLVAEFPHAFYVPSTMTLNGLWSSDLIHPNDRGMAQRANDLETAITSTIRARLESRRLSNLSNSNFAIV